MDFSEFKILPLFGLRSGSSLKILGILILP